MTSVDAALTPGDAAKAASQDASQPALEAAAPVACDLGGVWALKLQADVTSPATTFSNSSGQTRLWLLLNVRADAGAFVADTQLCGVDFPAISLLPDYGGESYQIQFPRSSSAEPDGMPSGSVRMRADSGGVSFDPFAVLMGVKLDNDVQAAWPADGTSLAFDADGDGAAGITTSWSTSDGKLLPPVDLSASTRAKSTLLAGRVVLGASKFAGCDSFNGSAGAARLDTQVLGCTLSDGKACTGDQASIQQTIKPDYSAAKTTLQAKKLASGRCVDVLKAFP